MFGSVDLYAFPAELFLRPVTEFGFDVVEVYAVRDFLADDYQVGKLISALGLRVRLSTMPVSTYLDGDTWRAVWDHQVRWARTIRVSRSGYFGLPVTHATIWAVVAAAAGLPRWAVILAGLRLASGAVSGILVLQDPLTARLWWLMPVRDLFGAAVWVAGTFGKTVLWRGARLRLHRSGRMEPQAGELTS